jgi:hypothetical protein
MPAFRAVEKEVQQRKAFPMQNFTSVLESLSTSAPACAKIRLNYVADSLKLFPADQSNFPRHW